MPIEIKELLIKLKVNDSSAVNAVKGLSAQKEKVIVEKCVEQVMQRLDAGDSFRMFFENAPNLNEKRRAITGVICGVRVEEIKDPLMQEIRYLDKLVDELAKGKKMSSILRE